MDGDTWSKLTPDGKTGWLTVPEDDKKKILMKGKVRKPSNPQGNSSRLNAQAHEVECNDDEDPIDPSSLHAGHHEQRQAPNKATVPQDSTADTNVQSVTEDDSLVLPPSHYTPPLRGSITASPPTGHTAPSPTAVTTPEETSPIVYEVNMHNVNDTPTKGPRRILREHNYGFANPIDQTHIAHNQPSDAPSKNQMIIPQAPTPSLAQSPLTTSLIVDCAQLTQPRRQLRIRTFNHLVDDVVITDHGPTSHIGALRDYTYLRCGLRTVAAYC